MFLAPILCDPAILTGISMALMTFWASGGLPSLPEPSPSSATGWERTVDVDTGRLVYFLIYYFLFSFAIPKFSVATPAARRLPRSLLLNRSLAVPDARAALAGAVG